MPNRRRYDEYPNEYFGLLDEAVKGEPIFHAMSKSDAQAQAHDLYRFFRALDRAYRTDSFAAKYADIARQIMVSVRGLPQPGLYIRKRPLLTAPQEVVNE
jgi:hypothetical protein